uniref:Uncharacterized protein LOC117367829 n=1 Tax=Geotrypetes seraphini TaxID=260995 RepID=A0A6P8SNZ3_GEOSA|nr:uncharacterized protein LOC117367829 [Geotrypetes seraphini]
MILKVLVQGERSSTSPEGFIDILPVLQVEDLKKKARELRLHHLAWVQSMQNNLDNIPASGLAYFLPSHRVSNPPPPVLQQHSSRHSLLPQPSDHQHQDSPASYHLIGSPIPLLLCCSSTQAATHYYLNHLTTRIRTCLLSVISSGLQSSYDWFSLCLSLSPGRRLVLRIPHNCIFFPLQPPVLQQHSIHHSLLPQPSDHQHQDLPASCHLIGSPILLLLCCSSTQAATHYYLSHLTTSIRTCLLPVISSGLQSSCKWLSLSPGPRLVLPIPYNCVFFPLQPPVLQQHSSRHSLLLQPSDHQHQDLPASCHLIGSPIFLILCCSSTQAATHYYLSHLTTSIRTCLLPAISSGLQSSSSCIRTTTCSSHLTNEQQDSPASHRLISHIWTWHASSPSIIRKIGSRREELQDSHPPRKPRVIIRKSLPPEGLGRGCRLINLRTQFLESQKQQELGEDRSQRSGLRALNVSQTAESMELIEAGEDMSLGLLEEPQDMELEANAETITELPSEAQLMEICCARGK